MFLTERQRDALGEVINIAFARTAASLSQLSGQRVLLDAPGIDVLPINEVANSLSNFIKVEEVVTVHQIFSGPVAGDALLMLDDRGARTLTDLLCDPPVPSSALDEADREALTEVGNILLNACLGVFGNLLRVHVTFSMPRLYLENLDKMLRSIIVGTEDLRYGVVVSTEFRIRESAVSGYLALVLGVSSLERLLKAIERWEEEQA
jgi:chemotaxis protein CheC